MDGEPRDMFPKIAEVARDPLYASFFLNTAPTPIDILNQIKRYHEGEERIPVRPDRDKNSIVEGDIYVGFVIRLLDAIPDSEHKQEVVRLFDADVQIYREILSLAEKTLEAEEEDSTLGEKLIEAGFSEFLQRFISDEKKEELLVQINDDHDTDVLRESILEAFYDQFVEQLTDLCDELSWTEEEIKKANKLERVFAMMVSLSGHYPVKHGSKTFVGSFSHEEYPPHVENPITELLQRLEHIYVTAQAKPIHIWQ